MLAAGEVRLLRQCAGQLGLGPGFTDWAILKRALTHPSWASIRPEPHNRALEFLGDRVIGLAVAATLSARHVAPQELLDYSVDNLTLARAAQRLCLEKSLRRVLDRSAGSERGLSNALGDAFEALTGALYVAQGYHAALAFLHKHLIPPVASADGEPQHVLHPALAPGAALRSYLAQLLPEGAESPVPVDFRLVSTDRAKSHHPVYTVGVFSGPLELGTGRASSTLMAQRAAALGVIQTTTNGEQVPPAFRNVEDAQYRSDPRAILQLVRPEQVATEERELTVARARHLLARIPRSERGTRATSKKALASDMVLGRVSLDHGKFQDALLQSGALSSQQAAAQLATRFSEHMDIDGSHSTADRSLLRTLGDRLTRLWASDVVTRRRDFVCRQNEASELQDEFISLMSTPVWRKQRAEQVGLGLVSATDGGARRTCAALSRGLGVGLGLVAREEGITAASRLVDWVALETNSNNPERIKRTRT